MVRLQGELAVLKHNMDSEVSQAREEALSVMQITGGEGWGSPWTPGSALLCLLPAYCSMAPAEKKVRQLAHALVPTAC